MRESAVEVFNTILTMLIPGYQPIPQERVTHNDALTWMVEQCYHCKTEHHCAFDDMRTQEGLTFFSHEVHMQL